LSDIISKVGFWPFLPWNLVWAQRLDQGWANIFYGGPHWKFYCYRGPHARITFITSI